MDNGGKDHQNSNKGALMIRNDNVHIGSFVAVGTDPEVPVVARGRGAVVQAITWPLREGRGRRNYIASCLLADGSLVSVPERYLSAIPSELGLSNLVASLFQFDTPNTSFEEVIETTALVEVAPEVVEVEVEAVFEEVSTEVPVKKSRSKK